jgi:23S rRNA pseudouridine2457 synthase
MNILNHQYFIINKPDNMVSQFISTHKVGLLGDLNYKFSEGTHAIGRLDNHSEGLLILTTNKKVTKLLFQGVLPHKRTYLVQVNRSISEEDLYQLRTGVTIRIKGNVEYVTPACQVTLVENPENLCRTWEAIQEYLPTYWLLITLTEGKYHQVRKMTGAIRHRCKRLIRISIEGITLGDLQPGEVREMNENDFFQQLNIEVPV